jgi:hypothetical protein
MLHKCPECNKEAVEKEGAQFICKDCGKNFPIRVRNPGIQQMMQWLERHKPFLIERYLDPGETGMDFVKEIAVVVGFRKPRMNEKVGNYLNKLRPYLEKYEEPETTH